MGRRPCMSVEKMQGMIYRAVGPGFLKCIVPRHNRKPYHYFVTDILPYKASQNLKDGP